MSQSDDTREIEIPETSRASGTYQSFYANSRALVIGINNYQKAAPPLTNARNDAEAIATVLTDLHGFDVHTLYDDQATQTAILGWLRDRLPDTTDEDDRVVIFFAGHGTTRKNRQDKVVGGYLIPHIPKGNPSGYAQYIDMDELRKACHVMPAKHVLIMLDCCFSGVAAVAARATPPAPPKLLDDIYLQRITQRSAYQILTASAADELAADSGLRPGHSAFTGALLQGLEGGADHTGNGFITASTLAAYVRPLVSQETTHAGGQGQTPFFNYITGSGEGDTVFVLPEQSKVVQPARLPDEITQSIASPLRWTREGVAHELGRLLKNKDQALALAAHVALQSMQEDDSRHVRTIVEEYLTSYASQPQDNEKASANEAASISKGSDESATPTQPQPDRTPSKEALLDVLERLWLDPSRESQLIEHWKAATHQERHEATVYLIDQGCNIVEYEGKQITRSGLRMALNLWHHTESGLTDTETLMLLKKAASANQLRKIGVTTHNKTPILLLNELAKDEDDYVRLDAARNPSTPVEALRELAKVGNFSVRQGAASNPNICLEWLE